MKIFGSKIRGSILRSQTEGLEDQQSVWQLLTLTLLPAIVFFLYRSAHINGDAPIYADNILKLRLDDISIHVGYYLIGRVVYHGAELLNIPIDQALIILSVILGGLGTTYGFLFLRKLTGNKTISAISAILMAFSGYYFISSTNAEIYVPQVFFVLASAYYFSRGKAIVSGILFGIALLISPLSVFVGTFFLYETLSKKQSWRKFGVFALAAGMIFLPVFAPVAKEYLWGRRGLLKIGLGTTFPPFAVVIQNLGVCLVKSFHILSPGLIVGSVLLLLKDRRLFAFLAIMIFSHSILFLKPYDSDSVGAFLLQANVFFSVIIGYFIYGLFSLISQSRTRQFCLSISLLSVYALITIIMQIGTEGLSSPSVIKENKFAHAVRTFDSAVAPGYVLITSFWDGVAYAFYTRPDTSEELEATRGNKRWLDIERLDRRVLDSLLYAAKGIYVLESYAPSPGAKVLLSKQALKERRQRHSFKSRVEALDRRIALDDQYNCEDVAIYRLSVDTLSHPSETESGLQ